MKLSEKLKDIRRKNGYTQQQIADYLGLDRSTYTYYELGTTTPAIFTLKKICQFYNVSIDDFIREPEEPVLRVAAEVDPIFKRRDLFTENELELVKNYRKLNEEKKNAVQVMVKTMQS